MVLGLLKEKDISASEKLIELAESDECPIRDRIAIWKHFALIENPMPKAVDTQKDEEMNIGVSMYSFKDTLKGDLSGMNEDLDDSAYDEFLLEDDK